MKFKSKSGKKQIFAAIITLAVITLLILSGPASAINLGMAEFSNTTPEKGEVISTTATIEINSNERMSMPNAVGVFVDNELACGFAINADGSCPETGVTVTLLSTSAENGYGYADYGYGYGYNYGYTYGYSNQNGYGYQGYGYGYQQGYSNSKFTYKIEINTSYYSIGEHKIKLSVNVKPDPASQVYSSDEQTITITVKDNQQYADSETETVGSDVDELVFDSGSLAVDKVVIPSSIDANKSITLNLVALLSGDTVTIPNELTIVRSVGSVNYTAVIPAGTVITGPAGWDGKIILPTVKDASGFSVSSGSVNVVIDLGGIDELTFSNAVNVILGGMAGKKAAWTHGTVLTSINTACNNLTDHSNINTVSPRECSIDSGADLSIWTYHFTSFGAYTPSVASSSGDGGGAGGAYKPYVKPSNATNFVPADQNDSNAPVNVTLDEQKGFLAFITGAVIGALGTTGTTVAVIFIVAVIIAWIVVSRRKKKPSTAKANAEESEESKSEEAVAEAVKKEKKSRKKRKK